MVVFLILYNIGRAINEATKCFNVCPLIKCKLLNIFSSAISNILAATYIKITAQKYFFSFPGYKIRIRGTSIRGRN